MANQEHLNILKKGVEVWNQVWKQRNEEYYRKTFNFFRADLSHADLRGVYLTRADLRDAKLRGAYLFSAHLNEVNLSGANLSEADLQSATLSEADLSGANLSHANLFRARLVRANLNGANLSGADLRSATLSEATLSGADLSEADLSGVDLSEADLSGANLSGAKLININLRRALLKRADLHQADLFGAYLSWADFSDANLSGAAFFGAYLREANLSRANLSGVDGRRANFYWPDIRARFIPHSWGDEYEKSNLAPSGANLSGADLSKANLSGADLSKANLSGADLRETNLSWANLSEANLSRADLTGCFVYGISAWDVQLEETIQANLIITAPTNSQEPSITVDNLEVAQFIYLLLSNKKIRDVIDTITSKVVLLLGRFTPERKAVLDALRDELRTHGYVPILFDFDKPASRDITETVSTLAHLARFVIADITDAKSIPQELMMIVPNLPSVPVQPLILSSQHEYGMFEHFMRFPWVLPVYRYTDEESLLQVLKEKVIAPAEEKVKELER